MNRYEFHFDPNLLSAFMAVANAGTILGAAREIHLSQPAVTAQIRKLEGALKTELFKRSVTGVVLTEAGQRLYAHAVKLFSLAEIAAFETSRTKPRTGNLSMMASTTIAEHVIPKIIAQFRNRHPGIQIQLQVGNTEDVIHAVKKEDVSIGLVEGLPKALSLRLEPFVDDELVLAAPYFSQLKIQSLRQLCEQSIVWREKGSGTRDIVERSFAKAGIKRSQLSFALEFGSTSAIKSAVIEGMGVAFLSRWSIQKELELGLLKLISIPDMRLTRKFQWALRSNVLNYPADLFFDYARKNLPFLKI